MISRIFVPKSALCVLLCMLLTIATMGLTGCTYSQAQVTAAVTKVENGLKRVQNLLPQANAIEAELQLVQPDVAEYIAPILAQAPDKLSRVIAACDSYIANPGSDAYQAILNGLDDITAQLDSVGLKIAGIKNQQSQQKAAVWIALVSTGLQVGLGVLENYATKSQVKSIPQGAAHAALFKQARPLINRRQARVELADMGYTPLEVDYAMEAAGL